jgi:amino acid transporter
MTMPDDPKSPESAGTTARPVTSLIPPAVLLLAGGILLLIVLCFLAYSLKKSGGGDTNSLGLEFTLPILAIAGVLVLLIALGLISVSFAFFGLTDPKQALGLPEGSVRAVVALSLVVLFAILTIFLYGGLTGTVDKVVGLTQAEVTNLENKVGKDQILSSKNMATPPAESFSVIFRDPPNQASQDFAKQLLVLIGTLVTAVSSFYFGAQTATSAQTAGVKAVAAATASPGPPTPTLRGIKPPILKGDGSAQQFTVVGDDLNPVTRVRLIQGSNQILGHEIKSGPHEVSGTFTIDKTSPGGKWNIVLTDESGKVRAELADGVAIDNPAGSAVG